jgi:hypothetical protein
LNEIQIGKENISLARENKKMHVVLKRVYYVFVVVVVV